MGGAKRGGGGSLGTGGRAAVDDFVDDDEAADLAQAEPERRPRELDLKRLGAVVRLDREALGERRVARELERERVARRAELRAPGERLVALA